VKCHFTAQRCWLFSKLLISLVGSKLKCINLDAVVNPGREGWLRRTASLVSSSYLVLCLVAQGVVLSWLPIWSTPWKAEQRGYSSTSLPFLFLALALHLCWWSRSTTSLFAPLFLHEVNGVVGGVLPYSHAQMRSKGMWVGTAKTQMMMLS